MIDSVTRMMTRPWALFIQSLQGVSNSSAPSDAQYLVAATNGTLTAERVATNTATVTWDFATAGQAKANVPDNAVTDAKLRQSAGLSVIGRSANSTGNVADVVASTDGQVLRRSGTSIGFGAVDLANANAVTGTLPEANGGTFLQRATVTLTDAQIKALPTNQIGLVLAPAAGYWIKVIGGTAHLDASAGAYTNINATYADLHFEVGGKWQVLPLINDNSMATPLTHVSDFFGTAQNKVWALQAPYMDGIQNAGAAGSRQYIDYISNGGMGSAAQLEAAILNVGADNNGAGDWTGGNAANTLKITIYYVVEAL